MMTSAKIDPFHMFKVFSELFINDFNSTFQCIGILFAHCMKVQTADTVKLTFIKIFQCYAHSGIFEARIINIRFYFRIFWIYSYSAFNISSAVLNSIFMHIPLTERIKYNMIADLNDFCHIFFSKSRCKNMVFSIRHIIMTKHSFIYTACGCSCKIFAY